MDPAISPTSNTAMQPSLGQDATIMQPFPGQDIMTVQPSPGQDIMTVQPSPGQDIMTVQPSLGQDIMTVQPSLGQDIMTVQPSLRQDIMTVQPSPGQDIMTVQPSPGQDIMTVQPSLGQDIMTVQPSLGQDIMTVQPSLGQDIMTVQPSLGQDIMTVQPSLGQDIMTVQPSLGQDIMTVQPSPGQDIMTVQPSPGQDIMTVQPSLGQDIMTVQPSPGQDIMTVQPSLGQDIMTVQPSLGQDIMTVQPSLGQDIMTVQPSLGQDMTVQPSVGQDMTVQPSLGQGNTQSTSINTDLNKYHVSSDDEVTIVGIQKEQQNYPGSVIKIESSDEEEQLEIMDLSKNTKLEKSPEKSVDKESTRCHSPKDQTCSICLGEFDNKSFLDQCFHAFCFYCILQWSEIVRTCPLCKAGFSQIIHSVKSMAEYELHKLPANPNSKKAADSADRRFRYRTTVLGASRQNSGAASSNAWEERGRRRERMLSLRRRNAVKAKEKRRLIYARNLWVQTVTQTGRPKFRETSPQFFRSNPACTHRLVPWMTRELQCLLNDEPSHVEFVLQIIMAIINKIQIDSEDFADQLRPFLADKTEHFAHEFLSYARCPFDMTAYDERAQYDWPSENTQSVAETPLVVDISATGWDSPDEAGTSMGLTAFTSEPGPSGLSGSIDVSVRSPPIVISIDQSRGQDTDDWSAEVVTEQTVNQESDQNRNDVIELSPEVATVRIPEEKHRHKHKHKHRHKRKHRARNITSGNGLECSKPGPSPASKPPSSESKMDVIIVSSEGTGSPECVEISSHSEQTARNSTPQIRSSNSRSLLKSRDHWKSHRRLSRDSSSQRSKSHEDRELSRHKRRTVSRSRDDINLPRGRSPTSRNHSRHKRSCSRSVDSRTETYSSTLVSISPFRSRDSISPGGSKDCLEAVTRPSSPTEEEMKQEIVELEKKIAEDTKRLEELIKKQQDRNRGVRTGLLSGAEDSETDEQSR